VRAAVANGSARELALLWCAAAASALALQPLWLALAPRLPECVFHAVTGLPCPTCGTGRAAIAVLHGEPGVALVLNPLATVVGVGATLAGLVAPLWVWLGGPLPDLAGVRARRWVLAGVALALVNWTYLIATLGHDAPS
jgi:hypothetical protein